MRTETSLFALALLLTGCTPVEMRAKGPARVCHDEPAQGFVGGGGAASAIEGARRASGARAVRVVRPGEMMTMDFRADRLTVTVDAHGMIIRAHCG